MMDNNLNNAIIHWANKSLSSLGYNLKSNTPENIKNTPWSYVVRFETQDEYFYLKHTPNLLALEARIIKILHDQFHAFVPEIIIYNDALNCFLMNDSGRPLREILKRQFDTTLLCKAIDQFTLMQLNVADHVDILLDIGVPDWRLREFPGLYQELIKQKKLLIEDGLTKIEINELQILLPSVLELCKRLSDFSVKETIVQSDFHDNNILIFRNFNNYVLSRSKMLLAKKMMIKPKVLYVWFLKVQ